MFYLLSLKSLGNDQADRSGETARCEELGWQSDPDAESQIPSGRWNSASGTPSGMKNFTAGKQVGQRGPTCSRSVKSTGQPIASDRCRVVIESGRDCCTATCAKHRRDASDSH